jgi:hypothetical protein
MLHARWSECPLARWPEGGEAKQQEGQRHGRRDGETTGLGLREAAEHALRPHIVTSNRAWANKQELKHEFKEAELFVFRRKELDENAAQVIEVGQAVVAQAHLFHHEIMG